MNNKKNKSVILYYILTQQINIDDDDVQMYQTMWLMIIENLKNAAKPA